MMYNGILCGNFSANGFVIEPNKIDDKWEHICISESTRCRGHNFYYPKFYDLCYGDKQKGIEGFERYEMLIDKDITLNFEDGVVDIHIDKIGLYLCPMDIVLYSIALTIDTDSRKDITKTMMCLRNFIGYDSAMPNIKQFIDIAISPIMRYRQATLPNVEITYTDLITFGNKLKVFQIIDIDSDEFYDDNSNITLYEFATHTYLPNHDMKAVGAPSYRYFSDRINENMLTVFNSWKALSLLDSFTIMGTNVSSNITNWVENYFGMIYLYDIFVKCYLFDLNNNYNQRSANSPFGSHMNETYDMFETRYYFPDISYNFLPRLVHTYICNALEIGEEKIRIFERIERQSSINEKRADTKMNKLLFAMTCLTIISTIWDGVSLINEMYPFTDLCGTTYIGFRLFTSIGFAAIVAFLFIFNRRKS
jgi:hypothetical protein